MEAPRDHSHQQQSRAHRDRLYGDGGLAARTSGSVGLRHRTESGGVRRCARRPRRRLGCPGTLGDHVGFIRVTQFNEQTAEGLKKAITDLTAQTGDKLKGFTHGSVSPSTGRTARSCGL